VALVANLGNLSCDRATKGCGKKQTDAWSNNARGITAFDWGEHIGEGHCPQGARCVAINGAERDWKQVEYLSRVLPDFDGRFPMQPGSEQRGFLEEDFGGKGG